MFMLWVLRVCHACVCCVCVCHAFVVACCCCCCGRDSQRGTKAPARELQKIEYGRVYGKDAENPLTLREYQVIGLNWLLFNW